MPAKKLKIGPAPAKNTQPSEGSIANNKSRTDADNSEAVVAERVPLQDAKALLTRFALQYEPLADAVVVFRREQYALQRVYLPPGIGEAPDFDRHIEDALRSAGFIRDMLLGKDGRLETILNASYALLDIFEMLDGIKNITLRHIFLDVLQESTRLESPEPLDAIFQSVFYLLGDAERQLLFSRTRRDGGTVEEQIYRFSAEPVPDPKTDDVESFDDMLPRIQNALYKQNCNKENDAANVNASYEVSWTIMKDIKSMGKVAHLNASFGTKRNTLDTFYEIMFLIYSTHRRMGCWKFHDEIHRHFRGETGQLLAEHHHRIIREMSDDDWTRMCSESHNGHYARLLMSATECILSRGLFPGIEEIPTRLRNEKPLEPSHQLLAVEDDPVSDGVDDDLGDV
ncbi:hypothetical protein B0T24DRAFT_676281 [Lasiosphaeria ovina]|uniref:Uncharacterized protein n=1 Tax=Lasiosphaeria ovina TaxID=92902 RepID=A0AAE0TV40_9PEZI|nr:hypothetical protein B0T24DRAFT_676281 [Lasiosphaeria ovina]